MTEEAAEPVESAPRRKTSRGVLLLLLAALGVATLLFWPSSEDVESAIEPEERIRVTTVPAEAIPVVQWLFAEGIAEAQHKAFLQFETPGRVNHIGFDEAGEVLREGSLVRGPDAEQNEGTLIATVDDSDLRTQLTQLDAEIDAAEQQINAAEAAFALASRERDRQIELRERGVGIVAEAEAAEASYAHAQAQAEAAIAARDILIAQRVNAERQVGRTQLRAPFGGVIARLNIQPGDYALGPVGDPSRSVLEASAQAVVIDDRSFEVLLQLLPFQAELVARGQTALVAVAPDSIVSFLQDGETDAVMVGEVWSVSPSISLDRRSVAVRLRVTGQAGVLRDGDYVSAWIATAEEEQRPSLPYAAILVAGDEASVFTFDAGTQTVQRQAVELGLFGLERVVVEDGLEPGARVVAEGHHLLHDGASVVVIPAVGEASFTSP